MEEKIEEKDLGGRPTKYESVFSKQAYKLTLLGATDKELGDFFECDERTINRWKKDYPKFCQSIKKGKEIANAEVAEKLFKRATGYSHPDVDIKVIDGEIIKTSLIKHYPPDPTSMIFWLKNRQKSKWRDKVEQGYTDNDGNDINPVIIQLPDNGRSKNNSSPERVSGESSQ